MHVSHVLNRGVNLLYWGSSAGSRNAIPKRVITACIHISSDDERWWENVYFHSGTTRQSQAHTLWSMAKHAAVQFPLVRPQRSGPVSTEGAVASLNFNGHLHCSASWSFIFLLLFNSCIFGTMSICWYTCAPIWLPLIYVCLCLFMGLILCLCDAHNNPIHPGIQASSALRAAHWRQGSLSTWEMERG